jgi:hypothetical protein
MKEIKQIIIADPIMGFSSHIFPTKMIDLLELDHTRLFDHTWSSAPLKEAGP